MTESPYERVLELLRRVPRPPEAGPVISGASEVELNGLETRLGSSLPSKLRRWLGACNGIIAGPGALLGAKPDEIALDIAGYQALWPRWRTVHWLPVATDGSGNAYVIRGGTDDQAVYFVDCSDDPEKLAYVVGSSLINFLEFLLEKEIGEAGWPFDASFVTGRDPAIAAIKAAVLPWDAR